MNLFYSARCVPSGWAVGRSSPHHERRETAVTALVVALSQAPPEAARFRREPTDAVRARHGHKA